MLLYAPQVDIQAGIAAQGGRIQAGNVLRQVNDRGVIEDVLVRPATGKPAGVTLAAGATLDVSGLWTNAALDPAASPGLARRNGGRVALRSSGSIALGQGSLVDVSGGAAIQSGGKALAGRGGDLLLEAGSAGSPGVLALDGALAARGVDGGGKLTLQANQIRVVRAEQRGQAAPAGLSVLADSDFAQGFSQYELIGTRGLEVVEGAQLRVSMPLLRLAPDAAAATDKTRALQAWTPPLYQEDAVKSVLTQRKGASLTLQSGTLQTAQNELSRVGLTLAEGSLVAVDPGQRINLAGIGQITLNGTLQAWSGRIAVTALRDTTMDEMMATGSGRSLWVGERAVLDVAARAATAVNLKGQSYGLLQDGGSITLGGVVNVAKGNVAAPDLFIVLRPGSRLDASGASASLLANGAPVAAASAGGLIAISSANGLYLDGQMIARSGGAGGRRPPGAGAGHAGIQEQRDPGPGQGAARLRAVGQGDGGLACRAGQSRHGRRQAGLWPRHAGRRPAGARRLRRAGPAVQRSAQLRRRRHAEPGPEPAPVQPDPRHDARCRADGARSAGRALHHAGRRHRRQ